MGKWSITEIQCYLSSIEQSGRSLKKADDDPDMVQFVFIDAKFILQNCPSIDPTTAAEPFWFTPDYVGIGIESFDGQKCRRIRRGLCCLRRQYQTDLCFIITPRRSGIHLNLLGSIHEAETIIRNVDLVCSGKRTTKWPKTSFLVVESSSIVYVHSCVAIGRENQREQRGSWRMPMIWKLLRLAPEAARAMPRVDS